MTHRWKLTVWKLNPRILNKNRTEQFAKEIQDYLEHNDNGEVSLPVLWDACKAVMRGKVNAATPFLKRQREERLETLQAELKNLESGHKGTSRAKG